MPSTTKKRSSKKKAAPEIRRIRYAVVGLGYITQVAVLPAFAHAKNSELAALVSGDPEKLRKLGTKYKVKRRVSYDDLPELLRSGEIDAVFIALPNSLHARFTKMAAEAGVHVLCEKPMATTAAECEAMMRAAEVGGIELMVAYRLHFERANLEAIDIVQGGKIGEPRIFSADFTMQVRDQDNIRLQDELGGGTLYDIGIYCINAARYLFRSEPTEVTCVLESRDQSRFSEVEEMASAILRFPGNRLAAFTCSFGAADVSSYRVIGTKGDVRVEPAFEYADDLVHHVTVDGRTRTRTYPQRDQFAPELIHFSDCIRDGRKPAPSGQEGLNDVRIIEALYESASARRPVQLELDAPSTRPTSKKETRRPAVRKPALVNADSPGGD